MIMPKKETAEAKHTAGPWFFKEGNRENHAMSTIVLQKDMDFQIGFAICESRNASQRAEDIANARLMAASPDLLKACQEVMPALQRAKLSVLACLVQDAIDKATK